jgi:hypothetical protein
MMLSYGSVHTLMCFPLFLLPTTTSAQAVLRWTTVTAADNPSFSINQERVTAMSLPVPQVRVRCSSLALAILLACIICIFWKILWRALYMPIGGAASKALLCPQILNPNLLSGQCRAMLPTYQSRSDSTCASSAPIMTRGS